MSSNIGIKHNVPYIFINPMEPPPELDTFHEPPVYEHQDFKGTMSITSHCEQHCQRGTQKHNSKLQDGVSVQQKNAKKKAAGMIQIAFNKFQYYFFGSYECH